MKVGAQKYGLVAHVLFEAKASVGGIATPTQHMEKQREQCNVRHRARSYLSISNYARFSVNARAVSIHCMCIHCFWQLVTSALEGFIGTVNPVDCACI